MEIDSIGPSSIFDVLLGRFSGSHSAFALFTCYTGNTEIYVNTYSRFCVDPLGNHLIGFRGFHWAVVVSYYREGIPSARASVPLGLPCTIVGAFASCSTRPGPFSCLLWGFVRTIGSDWGSCYLSNLVDPASSHMLVSNIKPCMP